jgi:hypothetical protein
MSDQQQQFNIGDRITFMQGFMERGGRVIGKTQGGKLFVKPDYARDGSDQMLTLEPQKVRHAES